MAKRYIINGRAGISVVVFAATLSLLAICAALVIDIGSVVFQKARLSTSVDAAALAGAQELVTQPDLIQSVVENYIGKNDIEPDTNQLDVQIDTAARTVGVTASMTVFNNFASIFGMNSETITSTAVAKVENIRKLTGARPFAIVQQTFRYGELYTLKEGAGDSTSGNYAAIELGSPGASVYRDNLLYGYSGSIEVGDLIPTETGNIAGTTQTCIQQLIDSCNHCPECTYLSYKKNCSKIIFVPIVNTLDVNGKKYVTVLGFATFFLEGVTLKQAQADVIGRFITYNMQGETSSEINDYGTYGIRLIQ